MEVQTREPGPGVRAPTTDYRFYWAYIPHFIHVPFYVYAYAFGDCLVNSLYAVYQEAPRRASSSKYLDMLRAGGTKRHKELLAPFGLDAADPGFWAKGLGADRGLHRRARRRAWSAERPRAGRMTDEREHASAGACAAMPRSARAVGGLGGARSPAQRYLGRQARPRRACGGADGGARRAQGPADEGGADAWPPSRTRCPQEYVPSCRSCRPTRRRWAGRSSSAAWRPSWGRTGRSGSQSFEHEAAAAASLGQVHQGGRA